MIGLRSCTRPSRATNATSKLTPRPERRIDVPPLPSTPHQFRLGIDPRRYAHAAELDARHRRWWILWAPYHRAYVAFYLGCEIVDPLTHASATELLHLMAEVEHTAALPPSAHHRSGPRTPADG
ncbi:hypothetical protein GCM10027590_27670 [Nocardiopsis nanhaiensis]